MNSREEQINHFAESLRQAQEQRKTISPIRETIGVEDLELAYAIQKANTDYRKHQGERMVGYKIGLTSHAVQRQLGVDQPDFGILFNTMEIQNGGFISITEILQPKIETEVAFVLKSDLIQKQFTAIDIISAIDYALVSLEIVGSRIENWNIKITDTIADNASASHFVLGHRPVKMNDFDVVTCKMTMNKNGEKVSEGSGAACLGSPINAAIWLAEKFSSLGTPLKKGDLLLTGAVGPMVPVAAGDHIVAQIEGLGSVSVKFTN